MCVGIPLRLTAVMGLLGLTEGGEAVDLSLVPEAQPGDWVLTFLGAGRAILPEDEAAKIRAALAGLAAILAGGEAGAAFADLEARTPSLPPIFRPRWTRALPKDDTMTDARLAPHPLLTRLEADHAYPRLATRAAVEAFTARPGDHCLFIPGDPQRNLETLDAAVILPELRLAFQNRFDCAVVDDAIETDLREAIRALKTPGFLFFRTGRFLGAIEKVRDWADYLTRTQHILSERVN
jgi:hydrogenase-1 operon protein HyaE